MVDSPILDNQVIGNSYLRTSENRKTRYDKSHIGQTVAINNQCYQIRIIKEPVNKISILSIHLSINSVR